MSILKVACLGHPILRKKAKKLSKADILSPEIQKLFDDMLETVDEYDGVGLAAPQVHEPFRILAVNLDEENPRYEVKEEFRKTIFVNPVITPIGDETVAGWEGCLSLKDLRGHVVRHKRIHFKALDRNGGKVEFETDTFLAVVLQHEIDHLDGILLVDRVEDTTLLSFHNELLRYQS